MSRWWPGPVRAESGEGKRGKKEEESPPYLSCHVTIIATLLRFSSSAARPHQREEEGKSHTVIYFAQFEEDDARSPSLSPHRKKGRQRQR